MGGDVEVAVGKKGVQLQLQKINKRKSEEILVRNESGGVEVAVGKKGAIAVRKGGSRVMVRRCR